MLVMLIFSSLLKLLPWCLGLWIFCRYLPYRSWKNMQTRLGLEISYKPLRLGELAMLLGAVANGGIALYALYSAKHGMPNSGVDQIPLWLLATTMMLPPVLIGVIVVNAIGIPISGRLIEKKWFNLVSIVLCTLLANPIYAAIGLIAVYSQMPALHFSDIPVWSWLLSGLRSACLTWLPFQLVLLWCLKTGRGFVAKTGAAPIDAEQTSS